jgi:NDP-sugar pyrophosphorylase family protein
MNALVLSAGVGERMKPLTDAMPKPLLPVIHEPMIRAIIERLLANGIKRVGINCFHKADRIKQYLLQLGDRVHTVTADTLRGTGGALKNFQSFFTEDFIIHSGDVLSDVDIPGLVAYHHAQRACATLVLVKQRGNNIILVDDHDQVTHVSDHDEKNGYTFAGIGVLSRSVFSMLPREETFSIVDVFHAILENRGVISGYEHSSVWHNVNSPREYWRIHRDILTGRSRIDGITTSGTFAIHPTSTVRSKMLSGFVVVGAHAHVDQHVALENTVVFRGTNVSRGTYKNTLLSSHFCLHMN